MWFILCMARQPNMPNPENCSLAELEVAARAAPRQRGYVRSIAIKALLFGFSHEQVSALYSVSRRTLSRWVTWFNERGIDGLLDHPRSGRPRKISPDKGKEYRELIQHPDKADEIHWTAKKFHGYVTRQLQDDVGYRTVLRWLHEEGFRLKVPRPWPNGQDEEKRQAFIEKLKTYLKDPETEIWYLDETGIEGDPCPRRRWAQKGEKIRQPYEGTHVRTNVTGAVCPRTGEFYALILPHSDTEIFQTFLDQANMDIQFERRRNLLICDNASWHKCSSLNWGRFERIFLPPYSPDLNPIERLWLVIKGEWFSDFIAKTRDELIDQLCLALNWLIDRRIQNRKTCAIRTEF